MEYTKSSTMKFNHIRWVRINWPIYLSWISLDGWIESIACCVFCIYKFNTIQIIILESHISVMNNQLQNCTIFNWNCRRHCNPFSPQEENYIDRRRSWFFPLLTFVSRALSCFLYKLLSCFLYKAILAQYNSGGFIELDKLGYRVVKSSKSLNLPPTEVIFF